MKILSALLALACCTLAACNDNHTAFNEQMDRTYRAQTAYDTWAVDNMQQAQVRESTLEQAAIYPYHFRPQSAVLTDIGRRDLAVLVDAWREVPGALVVVRGDASDDLYARRRAALTDALQAAGVADRVTLADGFPNGRGIFGETIVENRRAEKQPYAGSSTDTGSITKTGVTNPAKTEGAP